METVTIQGEEMEWRGFANEEINPRMDLFAEISHLKKEKNAIVLAHYYQESDIQDIADFTGDSLELARKASATDARMIVFAGVHFMAETAKILNPQKKVVIPDLKAGCSLADSCPANIFGVFRKKHPDDIVVSYINCTAEIKAMSDYICTSSNAVKIIQGIPPDKKIIFVPDRNLGKYLMKKTGRDMTLWDGICFVHDTFSLHKILSLKEKYPKAKVIAHPECEDIVLQHADFIGSTSALIKFVKENPAEEFIVVTEAGIIHEMQAECPGKKFIPAPMNIENSCACGECPYMKKNTLEKVYLCMKYGQPEITVTEDIMKRALIPLQKMLSMN